MPRDGFYSHREAATQSVGNVEVYARLARLYHERTLKTPAEIAHHLEMLNSLIDAAMQLQSDTLQMYE